MKPHSQIEGSGQQAALESFYKVQVAHTKNPAAALMSPFLKFMIQANVYDATRKRLLCGREDMLALVAAQLKFQARQGLFDLSKPVWIDVRLDPSFLTQPVRRC